MRVLAISMEDELFDEFKTLIEASGMTQKAYVTDMVSRELEVHKQKHEEKLEEKLEDNTSPIKWEREDVIRAIDHFMLRNNRVPTQKEFRNENGLPSYNAAQRCLQEIPSEYCRLRLMEMQNEEQTPEQNEGFTMGM